VESLTNVERGKILLEMQQGSRSKTQACRAAVPVTIDKPSRPDPIMDDIEGDVDGQLQTLLPKMSLAGRMLLVLFGRELQQPGFISDLLLNVAPASGFGTRCYKSLGLRTLGGA
jgi:hypothetical protein